MVVDLAQHEREFVEIDLSLVPPGNPAFSIDYQNPAPHGTYLVHIKGAAGFSITHTGIKHADGTDFNGGAPVTYTEGKFYRLYYNNSEMFVTNVQ